jgi:hypothetical protein
MAEKKKGSDKNKITVSKSGHIWVKETCLLMKRFQYATAAALLQNGKREGHIPEREAVLSAGAGILKISHSATEHICILRNR